MVPHPSLERMIHHGPPPLSSPLHWCLLQTGTPPPLGSPSPQKRMTHHSTWCLLQTATPPPLGYAGGPPPLGACYRLVRPLSLGPQGAPLLLVPVTDWYAPSPWVRRGSPFLLGLLQTGMTPTYVMWMIFD